MNTVLCNNCGQTFSVSPGGVGMCPGCGTRADSTAATLAAPRQMSGSGLAIASFILGIVGILFCVCGIPNLLAAIFGVVALAKNTASKGLAIAGLVMGIVGLMMAPIGIALYLPAIQAAREAARRASCTVKIKNIGQEIAAYRQAHNGEYPPALDALPLGPTMLQCPSENSVDLEPDYVYAAPPEKDLPGTIILCEVTRNHPQLRNVLFAHGESKSMPEADFQREILRPQNSALAAELSKAAAQRPQTQPGHRHGD